MRGSAKAAVLFAFCFTRVNNYAVLPRNIFTTMSTVRLVRTTTAEAQTVGHSHLPRNALANKQRHTRPGAHQMQVPKAPLAPRLCFPVCQHRCYLSPSVRTSPTHLLSQTQSFGAISDGESGGGERGGRPQRALKAGSLDDILATKMRPTASADADGAGAASGGAAGAATPSHPNGNAAGGAAAGGSKAGGAAKKTPAKKRGSLDDILGIKVGKVVKGSTARILQEGDAVEVLTPPVGGGPSAFSPGVISRVHADGSVDVDLNTGRTLVQRPAKEVRMVRKRGLSASTLAPGELAVGDRVEAR